MEIQISIPETKIPHDSFENSEKSLFKNSLTSIRNEMPADVFKELANKSQNDYVSEIKSNKLAIQTEISEISPYSDKVNEYVRSPEELNVYVNNDLKENMIGDKIALINPNIDPEKTDGMGRTNIERMGKGLAPIDANGESYNLHHVGQKENSPLAELTNRSHKENDLILHDKSKPTEVHGENNDWNQERAEYWKNRAANFENLGA